MPGEESWDTSLLVGGGRKSEQWPETLREGGFGERGSVCVAAVKAGGWQGQSSAWSARRAPLPGPG